LNFVLCSLLLLFILLYFSVACAFCTC